MSTPTSGEVCFECGRAYAGEVELEAKAFDIQGLNYAQRHGWLSTEEVKLITIARRLINPQTVRAMIEELGKPVANPAARARQVFQNVWDRLKLILPLSWQDAGEFGWKCGGCAAAGRPEFGASASDGQDWVDIVKASLGRG